MQLAPCTQDMETMPATMPPCTASLHALRQRLHFGATPGRLAPAGHDVDFAAAYILRMSTSQPRCCVTSAGLLLVIAHTFALCANGSTSTLDFVHVPRLRQGRGRDF